MANKDKNPPYVAVAPFVGAWIEISDMAGQRIEYCVAPLVGAWAETMFLMIKNKDLLLCYGEKVRWSACYSWMPVSLWTVLI